MQFFFSLLEIFFFSPHLSMRFVLQPGLWLINIDLQHYTFRFKICKRQWEMFIFRFVVFFFVCITVNPKSTGEKAERKKTIENRFFSFNSFDRCFRFFFLFRGVATNGFLFFFWLDFNWKAYNLFKSINIEFHIWACVQTERIDHSDAQKKLEKNKKKWKMMDLCSQFSLHLLVYIYTYFQLK